MTAFIVHLPKGHLDYSQVAAYLRCGKQYFYKHVEDPPAFSNASLAVGRAAKVAVSMYAKYVEDAIAGKDKGNKRIKPGSAIAYTTLKECIAREADMFDPGAIVSEKYQMNLVEQAMECFNVWWRVNRHAVITHADYKVETTVSGIPFTAYIDYVEEDDSKQERLVNLQFYAKLKSNDWVQDNLQLAIYSLVTGIERCKLITVLKPSPGRQNASAFIDIRDVDISNAQRAHAKRVIEDVAEAISKRVFTRCMPGDWVCSQIYCEHFSRCRIVPNNEQREYVLPQDVKCFRGSYAEQLTKNHPDEEGSFLDE